MTKKILAVLMCVAMLVSSLSVLTYAATIEVEIDLGGLFDDDPVAEDPKDDGKTEDSKEEDKQEND